MSVPRRAAVAVRRVEATPTLGRVPGAFAGSVDESSRAWDVTIVKPAGGAPARFRVREGEGRDASAAAVVGPCHPRRRDLAAPATGHVGGIGELGLGVHAALAARPGRGRAVAVGGRVGAAPMWPAALCDATPSAGGRRARGAVHAVEARARCVSWGSWSEGGGGLDHVRHQDQGRRRHGHGVYGAGSPSRLGTTFPACAGTHAAPTSQKRIAATNYLCPRLLSVNLSVIFRVLTCSDRGGLNGNKASKASRDL